MVATGFFSAFTAPRQAEWNAASQKRVSRTAATIDNIKWIKLSGLTEFAFSAVKDLRVEELTVSKRCRKLLSWTVTLCKSLHQTESTVYDLTLLQRRLLRFLTLSSHLSRLRLLPCIPTGLSLYPGLLHLCQFLPF